MKVLVTGGAGFIGSNLAKALVADGHHVRVLDNFSNGDPRNLEGLGPRLEIIKGDITSPDDCARACDGIDAVSHQAALGSVPRSMLHPELYSWTNTHGFVVLCNQARQAGIRRVVYASSSSVYGDLTISPKPESMRGRPLSPYAASKQGNEDFAQAFHQAYGMSFVGCRYFNVFGPHQNPKGPYAAVIPLFIANLLRGESPTIYGDGLQSRDFTFVGNVMQANQKALTGELPPGAHIVNVACGTSTTVLALFQLIAARLGRSIQPQHAPEREGDIRHSLADIQTAQQLLGYESWTGLEQGLALTVDWFLQNPGRLS